MNSCDLGNNKYKSKLIFLNNRTFEIKFSFKNYNNKSAINKR